MNKYEIKVQEIFSQLYFCEDYSVSRLMNNYILVGYAGSNVILEVFTEEPILKPKNPWRGCVHVIKTLEEAKEIIYLNCLPF